MTASNETSHRSRTYTWIAVGLGGAAIASLFLLYWRAAALDRELGAIARDRAHYEAQRKDALARREAQVAENAELEARRSEISAEIARLQAEHGSLSAAVTGLGATKAELEQEITRLKQDREAAQAKIAEAGALRAEREDLLRERRAGVMRRRW